MTWIVLRGTTLLGNQQVNLQPVYPGYPLAVQQFAIENDHLL